MRREVLKGHLDVLLLAVLDAQPAHGYEVIEALRRRSEGAFDLAEGTVYPALHRLEAAGLLRSAWVDGGPRPRRVYELTRSGRRKLDAGRRDWSAFAVGVRAVLGEAT